MTAPTRLLGGRYEIGGPIGEGGMAEVFRGVDVRLGRDVAIKVLRPQLARDPSFQLRFRREAQAAAALNAPEIVSVYDTGVDEAGVPYIVMEFIDGRTLREVLQTEGRLLPQRALEVVAAVCAALDAAHTAGLVHRDIKPGNVMLDRAGEVKVMDFGIARAGADLASTQTAAVIGTAAYLSPEQARGEFVDARSDLYSTGCMLYELLTGGPPFSGENAVAVAYQHVREEPDPPSAYDRTLPPEVDAVVLKAMAKNPAYRYQSAQEMREDLLRARAGEPVWAEPVLEPLVALAPAAVTYRDAGRRSWKRGVAYSLFGLVLASLVIGIALLLKGLLGVSSDVIPTPGVVGLDQREAVIVLAQAGLRVGDVRQKFVDAGGEPFGQVLEQSPSAQIVSEPGGRVDLVVSGGVEMTIIPDGVIGLQREEAVARLVQAKLRIGSDVRRKGNYPEGTVLALSPVPGRQVVVGSEVVLTIASGDVDVPDVRGQSRDTAEQTLQRAGFSVGVTLFDSTGPPGLVLDQSPVNIAARRGSTVVITVSQVPVVVVPSPQPSPGAASPAPEPSPAASPAASPAPAPSPS